ncbi:MAG: hypothetical protein ACJAZ1_002284 [Yoonia sp.]|jgi:hypothetical protein
MPKAEPSGTTKARIAPATNAAPEPNPAFEIPPKMIAGIPTAKNCQPNSITRDALNYSVFNLR